MKTRELRTELFNAFVKYRAYWDIAIDLSNILKRYDGLMHENDFQTWLLTALQDKPEGYKEIISLNSSYKLTEAREMLISLAEQYEQNLKEVMQKILKEDRSVKIKIFGRDLFYNKDKLHIMFKTYSYYNQKASNEEVFEMFIDDFRKNY